MPHRTSIQHLIEGHRDFRESVFPRVQDDYVRLGSGQSPRIAFLTCSDSRVNPWVVTQSNPGDLFVIRNAGNLVPAVSPSSGELATLEYAVEALKVEHIVVCGHSDCGAMKGVLDPGSCAHLAHVPTWLAAARPALDELRDLPPDDPVRLDRLVTANVGLQLRNLRALPFVADAIEAGRLALHGMVFDIGSATLWGVDEAGKNYNLLGEAPPGKVVAA